MKKLKNFNFIKGFTLVELLVVIGVIAMIIAVMLPNLVGVRGRARDAKRKAEMRELKSALRLYYNDYQTYPAGSGVDEFDGCGDDGTKTCVSGTDACNTAEFAAGGSSAPYCGTIYMKRLPRMASDGVNYGYLYWQTGTTVGDDFCLQTTLENPGDKDISVSQARCASACFIGSTQECDGATDYCTCAD